MKNAVSIATVFPQHFTRLHKMRVENTILDELCRDFELLSTELASSERPVASTSHGIDWQIVDSLNGLTEEISELLSREMGAAVPTVPVQSLLSN